MHAKLTSKNQITIPIAAVTALGLHKGEILSVNIELNRLVLTPQVLEDKYPQNLLKNVEEKLEKGPLPGEKKFSSTKDLLDDLKA